jgi:hypothetical protein
MAELDGFDAASVALVDSHKTFIPWLRGNIEFCHAMDQ